MPIENIVSKDIGKKTANMYVMSLIYLFKASSIMQTSDCNVSTFRNLDFFNSAHKK